MAIIILCNIFLGTESFGNYELWIATAVTLSVIIEIAISALGNFVCLKLPERMFSSEKKFFQVSKREQRFYEKIGIKSWKDKVWELGGLGGFRKNKLKDAGSSTYLHRFIIESNRGLAGHVINIFTGFLVILILPLKYAWRIGFPVACVGALLNILPSLVLRYNLPKLHIAHKRATRLEERAKQELETNEDESIQSI